MSAMQRTKGASGEREIAGIIRDLTGWSITRRCRQHDGDSDLIGVPGWSIEVKRHKDAGPGKIAAWWRQAVVQATDTRPVARPALLYRLDRRPWRAVWPVWCAMHDDLPPFEWLDYDGTADSSIEAWVAVAREIASQSEKVI